MATGLSFGPDRIEKKRPVLIFCRQWGSQYTYYYYYLSIYLYYYYLYTLSKVAMTETIVFFNKENKFSRIQKFNKIMYTYNLKTVKTVLVMCNFLKIFVCFNFLLSIYICI